MGKNKSCVDSVKIATDSTSSVNINEKTGSVESKTPFNQAFIIRSGN